MSHNNTNFGENYNPLGHIAILGDKKPLSLECGKKLSSFPIAYQTYGSLNKDKSNAILICHALTGDQFVGGENPHTKREGWWNNIIGKGNILDTDRYFIICSNVLGSCMGSAGPASINPETGKKWQLDFPVITVGDMVKAQKMLIESLGISKLFCIIGGSAGGMQTLEWISKHSEMVHSAIPMATSYRMSPQNIGFDEVGRQAIMNDPNWENGKYSEKNTVPKSGLAVARMAAHITYLSEKALSSKFGRKLQNKQKIGFDFNVDFQIESYLRHQGSTFVDRFDANSYLYLTKALDYFDLETEAGGRLADSFKDCSTKICLVSFSSDWMFPTADTKTIVKALNAVAANVSFVEIKTDKGHDAFLLDEPVLHKTMKGFIEGNAKELGIWAKVP